MENDPQSESTNLSKKQLAALPYLVSSPSLSEAARRASVHRVTLHRWLSDPQFRKELESAREDAADLARSELRGLMLKAAAVLAESLEDPSPTIRLRASKYAFSLGFTVFDLEELRKGLGRINDAFDLWSKKNPPRP